MASMKSTLEHIMAEYDRAQQEILLLREEIRIKDVRMALTW